MSKNIIERNMDGFINVINKNQGACFTIKVLLSNNKKQIWYEETYTVVFNNI